MKTASRLFGGDKVMTRSLLARINAMEAADTVKDIIVQKQFRFHNLGKKEKNLKCCYAIDVKTKRDAWRIILELLNENDEVVNSETIDVIATTTRKVMIMEVSKHYE